MKELQVRNRQRDRTINTALLRSVTTALLEELLGLREYELAVHFVSARKMAELNEHFLQHAGPTDVITFNLREGFELPEAERLSLAGEIYICVSEAERQAKEFKTQWCEELARYVVHGVLHLSGYDDITPPERKRMKGEENRLTRVLGRRFKLTELAA